MRPGPDKMVKDYLDAWVTSMLDPATDPLWAEMLEGYETADIAELRNSFRAKQPTVKLGWARDQERWPIWCVVIGAGTPNSEFMAKLLETLPAVPAQDPGEHKSLIGYLADIHVSIVVYTENADDTRFHGELVEAAMLMGMTTFLAKTEQYNFAGMTDLAPDERWAPDYLWVRTHTYGFTCTKAIRADLPGKIIKKVFVGVDGEDMGDGHTGHIVPEG